MANTQTNVYINVWMIVLGSIALQFSKRMKGLSLCRQINVEDISELTPRRNAVVVKVRLNKPPQLEEVDQKISQLVDVLMILEQSLDKLEQEYFQDIAADDESIDDQGEVDESWSALHKEYNEEIEGKDDEYEALLKRFDPKITTE